MACSRNSTPIKFIESTWAAAHLPMKYTLSSDLFPVNRVDSIDTITSISSENGFMKVTLFTTYETYLALESVKVSNTPVDSYNKVHKIIRKNGDGTLILSGAWVEDVTEGAFQRAYTGYNVRVRVYAGIPPGHSLYEKNPMRLISDNPYIPDSNNEVEVLIDGQARNDFKDFSNNLCEALGQDPNVLSEFVLRATGYSNGTLAADELGGVYTLSGGMGSSWSGSEDNIVTYSKRIRGDFSLIARVVSFQNQSTFAQAGVIVRKDNGTDDQMVAVIFFADTLYQTRLTSRATKGGNKADEGHTSIANFPYYARIDKVGNTYTAYISADGLSWSQIGATKTIDMGDIVYAGLYGFSSDGNDTDMIVTFDNVTIPGQVKGIGNDWKLWTSLRIEIAESYAKSNGSSVETFLSEYVQDVDFSGNLVYINAMNAVRQFVDPQGNTMADYVVADVIGVPEIKFLTVFDRPVYTPGYEYDLAIGVDYDQAELNSLNYQLRYKITQRDRAGNLLFVNNGALPSSDRGVYRISLEQFGINSDAHYLEIQIDEYNTSTEETRTISEVKRVDIDRIDTRRSPTQLRWLNSLGAWESWLFYGASDKILETSDAKVIENNVFTDLRNDFTLGQSYRKVISREAVEGKIVRSHALNASQLEGLRTIFFSTMVIEVFEDSQINCANRRYRGVIVNQGRRAWKRAEQGVRTLDVEYQYSDYFLSQKG